MSTRRKAVQVALVAVLSAPVACWALNNQESITPEVAELYEKALIEFNKGNTATSIIHLKNILLEQSDYLSAHVLLGRAYLEEGQGTLAEKELKRAQALGADKSLITEDIARSLMLQVKFREVLDRIRPLNKSPQEDSTLLVYRGQSYFNLGQIDKAQMEYEEALQLNAKNINAYLGLATIKLAGDDFQAAENFLGRAVDIDHQDASVWYTKGALHHAQGQIEQATIAYETALDIDPKNFNAKLSHAGLFMDRQDYASAVKAFQELYEISPESPQVAYFLSVATLRLGDADLAKTFMREAKTHMDRYPVEVINDHGPTLMLAGLIHYDLTEYQAAKNYFLSFVNRFPRDVRARLLLGKIYILEGAWPKASAILEPAMQFNPRNYQLLLLLGDAYMKKKDYYKASQIFDLAAEYYPDDANVKTKSGLNDILRGDTQTGMKSLGDAVEINAQATSAGFILVTNLLKNGKITEALDVVSRLAEKNPENLIVQNLLATSQLKAGRWSEARQTWKNALSKDPNFKLASVNLIKLDIKEGKIDEAEAQLLTLLDTDPDNTIYLYDLSDIQLRKQQMDQAQKTLEKILTLDPKSYKATDRLTNIYVANGEPGKAVKVSSKLAGEYYEHAGSYFLLGRSQIAFGEPYKATSSLKKASLLAGHDSLFLKEIARLQLQIDDLTAAIHSINKYLDSYTTDPEGWHLLAVAKMRLDQDANIDEPVAQLVKLGLQPLADQLLGDLAYQKLDYVTAQKYYRAALKGSSSPETAERLFTALSAEKGMEAGADFLLSWLESNPQSYLTREMLARAYVTTGQFKKAKTHLELLVNSGWESPATIVNLAYVYQLQGHSKANELATRAVSLLPEDPFALDIMGWSLVQSDDYAGGLTYLRDANARDSRSPTIKYHIAFVLHKLERDAEARRYLTQIVEGEASFAELAKAKELLSSLGAR